MIICKHGNTGKRVVLFGDSHALQWRGPLERVADARGWRLYFITKSGCAVARIGSPAPDCAVWREAAIKAIAGIHADMVIVSSLDAYRATNARTDAAAARLWRRGLASTLRSLDQHAGRVILLGDTSRWIDPPKCLAEHLHDIAACSMRRAAAIKPDRIANNEAAAKAAGVSYRRTVDLTCPYDPCPAVIDQVLHVIRRRAHDQCLRSIPVAGPRQAAADPILECRDRRRPARLRIARRHDPPRDGRPTTHPDTV